MTKKNWIDHQWGMVYKTKEKANKVATELRKQGWETKIVAFKYKKGLFVGEEVTGYHILKRRQGK